MIRIIQLAAATLIVVGLFAWFGVAPITTALERASAPGLLVYALLTAAVLAGYALRWRLVAHALGMRPPLGRLISARLAGDAVGVLVPSARLAGEPVRVVLTRGTAPTTSHSAAAVALDRILEMIGNTIAALLYVVVICLDRGIVEAGAGPIVTAVIMAAALIGLVSGLVAIRSGRRPVARLYALVHRLWPRVARWSGGLSRFEEHVARFCREHPRDFAAGLALSLLIEATIVVQYAALFAAFAISLDLATLLVVLLGTGAARAAPIPAGLGALEATQVALVGAAAGQPELGFVVAMIVRLHETLLLIAGLAALSAAGLSVARLRRPAERPA